ncbi:restriction endonuclease [Frankia sp. AiPs1]|uniref:restriction endonuclease n=1 Tax=Frankia sp. AiPs1 TaxID=573493 RepID=UPI002042DB26|nr:restriction endonuclease [Frankia sp. AiPs1]MCM3921091.1 restriction endonuclease [Frankia sp. AiPs1]
MELNFRTEKQETIAEPWLRYEHSIASLIKSLDSTAEVSHNQKIHGHLSKSLRQVDVWAQGTVAGIQISIAVECKRHQRKIDTGIVDQFVGKLLDLKADRGIIYSHSGFTDNAVTRAVCASSPFVLAVSLETPEVVTNQRGVPGYPADLLAQESAPQWIEELDRDAFRRFLEAGEWSKFWS